MTSLLFILPGILAWMVTGACVMNSIDNESRDLYRWVARDPTGLVATCLFLFWPVVLVIWLRK